MKYLQFFIELILQLCMKPAEIPRNLFLCVQCIWNVKIKGKTLVVLHRWVGIGDLVCMLGSVNGLRARHPYSWVVVICPPGTSQLAISSGLCDAASDVSGFIHWFVDRAFSQVVYHPVLPDELRRVEAQQRHLADEFAHVLGVKADSQSIRFEAPRSIKRQMARRLKAANPEGRPVIIIHPGPTWVVREWPLARWAELAETLHTMHSAIIINIGNDLDAYTQTLRPMQIHHALNWSNELRIMDTVALLEQASVFVGIDSGPLHIATAMGVPSVGLFGPTDGRLIVHPRARTIIVSGAVNCLGCHHLAAGPLHWKSGCPNSVACMQELSSDKVLSAVVKCLFSKATIASSASLQENIASGFASA